MVRYLPDLLRLSVNGIDRNDSTKIYCTLGMYYDIFSWLPITKNYSEVPTESYPERYISLASKDRCAFDDNCESFSVAFSLLGPAVEAWISAFLDKFFIYASNAEISSNIGERKNKVNGICKLVCETVEVILSATDEEMHLIFTSKILDFLRQSPPVNATKELSSMLDSLVFSSPSVLPKVLEVLIDEDIRSRKCSTEKLACRMSLIAGALTRGSEMTLVAFPVVKPLFEMALTFSDQISEKTAAVRTAAGDILKSLLKGLASFYPLRFEREFDRTADFFTPKSVQDIQVKTFV